ncbi:MAG: hypothetical protein LBE59_12090 [Nevskiaceae bacterium]|nr:hypothetical protein [Nevskiaceae bacterium]
MNRRSFLIAPASLLIAVLSIPVFAADAKDTRTTEKAVTTNEARTNPLASLPNDIEVTPLLHISGQPSGDQLALLHSAGIHNVIDLRPDAEHGDFDERMVVVHLGLGYDSLPIRGTQDMTPENVKTFDQLLTRKQADGVLVHCASGNRVGAMMALRARWLQGKSALEALAIGKASGLTSLEADVRKLLDAK